MTLAWYTTRQGKIIHKLSLADLRGVVRSGARLRAFCPVHGSDHQRSLSIDTESLWGFCHSCHATVLMERWSGQNITTRPCDRQPKHWQSDSQGRNSVAPVQRYCPTKFSRWQSQEIAAITAHLPMLRQSFASSDRARAYLNARCIPTALAFNCGIGYFSPEVWQILPREQRRLLKSWRERLIFPLHSPDGAGFIGRSLLAWQLGMDEDSHKTLLAQHSTPRWFKTYPAGWFGLGAPEQLASTVILVEGGFDRLALLAGGIPAASVLALAGCSAQPAWLLRQAPQVKHIILALDADDGGQQAMERLARAFRNAAYTVSCCPPLQDCWGKDWSERYRRSGLSGLQPLLRLMEAGKFT